MHKAWVLNEPLCREHLSRHSDTRSGHSRGITGPPGGSRFMYIMLGSSRGLGHRPFTAGTRVRISYRVPSFCSQVRSWATVGDQPTATFLISHSLILEQNDTKVP